MPGLLPRKAMMETLMGHLRTLVAQDTLPPWKQPWNGESLAALHLGFHNPITGRRYQGTNTLLLATTSALMGYTDPRFMGFQQALKAGWNVRKGEHATTIFHPVAIKVRKKKDGEPAPTEDPEAPPATFLMMKAVKVFNAAQIEGIPPLMEPETPAEREAFLADSSARVQAIASVMGVPIEERPQDQAYYHRTLDHVVTPPRQTFKSLVQWDNVCLHELAHASGHETRLNRPAHKSFGDVVYAAEEVTAELTAWLASLSIGLPSTGDNPEDAAIETGAASYCAAWSRRVLERNPEEGWALLEQSVNRALAAHGYLNKQHTLAIEQGLIPPLAESVPVVTTEETPIPKGVVADDHSPTEGIADVDEEVASPGFS